MVFPTLLTSMLVGFPLHRTVKHLAIIDLGVSGPFLGGRVELIVTLELHHHLMPVDIKPLGCVMRLMAKVSEAAGSVNSKTYKF